jgi:hypothetical protein
LKAFSETTIKRSLAFAGAMLLLVGCAERASVPDILVGTWRNLDNPSDEVTFTCHDVTWHGTRHDAKFGEQDVLIFDSDVMGDRTHAVDLFVLASPNQLRAASGRLYMRDTFHDTPSCSE